MKLYKGEIMAVKAIIQNNVFSKPRKAKFPAFNFKSHFAKIGVIILNLLMGNMFFYRLVGAVNRRFRNKPIRGVFLLYPANEKYTKAYVYSWYAKTMKWRPRLVGIFKQEKCWGLIFGISALELDFLNLAEEENLRKVEQRMDRIKNVLGAEQKTFAGVIPSILMSRRIISKSVEAEVTVSAVMESINIVKTKEKLPDDTPILILGAKGFIGCKVIKVLHQKSCSASIFAIDLKDVDGKRILCELKEQDANLIILNVSKRGAINTYIPDLWNKVVIINEVYPEPGNKEIKKIEKQGASCYHVVGIKGKAWPPFPMGYEGGVPCCASFLSNKVILSKKC
jgi:hypothetical protein